MDLYSPPLSICSVLMASKPKEVTTVKVKAFIVTLTGNLKFWWHLECKIKISDGNGITDVDFVDEILTSLIGFSVSEMKQLKKDRCVNTKSSLAVLQKCQRD